MAEYIYRVVDQGGAPIGGDVRPGPRSRQHFYTKESVAQGVATQKTNAAYEPNPVASHLPGIWWNHYRVQRAAVVWEEIDNG